jgi:hypothetical protein
LVLPGIVFEPGPLFHPTFHLNLRKASALTLK